MSLQRLHKRYSILHPGEALNPEWIIRDRILKLRELYKDSHERIKKKLFEGEITTGAAQIRAAELLAQTEREVRSLAKASEAASESLIGVSYRAGAEGAAQALEAYGKSGSVSMRSRIHSRAVAVIANQMAEDLAQARGSAIRTYTRFVRATQQAALEEETINRAIAQGLVEGKTRVQVSKNIAEEFRKKIKNGQVIEINGRFYDIDQYSELVARTRTREAATLANENMGMEFGVDLVQIDVHGDACPICQMRQGRIYSSSGGSEDFPPIPERPPYHPNCRCNLYPVDEDILRRRGEFEQVKRLTQNTPNRAGMTVAEAQKWIEDHPTMAIADYNDYQAALGGNRESGYTYPPKGNIKVTD